MIKRLALLLVLLVAGCATADERGSLPPDYVAWSIGYTAPPYMDVWIETIDVEDMKGRVFGHVGSGTASIAFSGNPAGWRPPRTLGGGRFVRGAALPKRVYVRWQSLVEPQTYHATFDVPQRARQLMLERDKDKVTQEWYYRSYLILDLAPGGWVKAWVRGPASDKFEVACVRAEIEPQGPSQGTSNGRYVTLDDASKAYIASHPIPYDSWNCGT